MVMPKYPLLALEWFRERETQKPCSFRHGRGIPSTASCFSKGSRKMLGLLPQSTPCFLRRRSGVALGTR